MLIVKRQDQTGNESETVTGNATGMLWKRGLPAEISGSLETGGNAIPLRPMRGTGLYDIVP
jgi:hypothetical protein